MTTQTRVPLRAEWTKFHTVRSLPWLAVIAVLVSVLMALLFVMSLPITQGTAVAALPSTTVVEAALLGVDVAMIVLIVMGASFAGSEYATGLAQLTFVLTPRRGRVVLAKLAVTGAVAAVVGAVAATLCTFVGQLMVVSAAPLEAALVRLAAGSVLTAVFYALVAVAAALVVRSTGGGVVTALALLALPTVLHWIPGLDAAAPLLPSAALHGISGASEPGQAEFLSAATAIGSLIAWTVLIGAVAVWRVASRDV
ncbi:MAG: hypothetical protein ACRDRK_16170 [Pseudonocardia sp.]